MPKRSSSSAGATYLDRDARRRDLEIAARRAADRDPSIRRVVLFGSLAHGTPTPRSDADLLVVVATSRHARPRDRVPEMLGALAPLPCPVDIFVLTAQEADGLVHEGSPLVRVALETGIDLL